MTQLMAEQMLMMLETRCEPERTEWSTALGDQIGDAARDQRPYEMVMQRASRVVAQRDGTYDETHGFLDYHGRICKRESVLVTR